MANAAIDHRVRVATERRERMRARLVNAALLVFAQEGMSSNFIEKVVQAAKVSRGTFYNYFSSSEALLEAVSTIVSRELIRQVDVFLMTQPDPAMRIASGVRLCLQAGLRAPQVAAFISRGGHIALQDNEVLKSSLSRDLSAGIATGQFVGVDLPLAYDLVVGPVMAMYHRCSVETVAETQAVKLTTAILMSLGVSKATARKLSSLPLPEVIDDQLILKNSVH